ncbi:MAG: site-specific integrase [Planctomycetota bacterium]|nr:site-specific integrase [Planctomycetota bacterium]
MTDTQETKRKRRRNPYVGEGFNLVRPTWDKGKRKSPHWHIWFKDHRGRWCRLTGFSDKTASARFARQLVKLVKLRVTDERLDRELGRWVDGLDDKVRDKLIGWSLLDRQRSMGTKPIAKHIGDWHKSILADGATEDHAGLVRVRVENIVDGCGFNRFADIDESAVKAYLVERRRKGAMKMRTRNHYVRAIKQFCTWMVHDYRASSSPVAGLKMIKVTDETERRALSLGQLRKLLRVAQKGPAHMGMAGPDRCTLYWLAAETGFRAGELGSLQVAGFKLHDKPPTVTARAGYTKGKRRDTLPITGELAERMRMHLADKAPRGPAFTMPDKTAAMLRFDLEAAGIPYVDDVGDVFDFHALRVQCATELVRGGAHPATAQQRMRHSDPRLTANLYTKLGLGGHEAALDALPKLSVAG